jgi:hypothetical protein
VSCRAGEVGVQQVTCLALVTGHQVAVPVEGCDLHAQRLRVHAGGDHERRERVPTLVEADRLEARGAQAAFARLRMFDGVKGCA